MPSAPQSAQSHRLGPRDARDSPCQIALVTHDAMQGRTADTVSSAEPSPVSSNACILVGWSVEALCNGTSFFHFRPPRDLQSRAQSPETPVRAHQSGRTRARQTHPQRIRGRPEPEWARTGQYPGAAPKREQDEIARVESGRWRGVDEYAGSTLRSLGRNESSPA